MHFEKKHSNNQHHVFALKDGCDLKKPSESQEDKWDVWDTGVDFFECLHDNCKESHVARCCDKSADCDSEAE